MVAACIAHQSVDEQRLHDEDDEHDDCREARERVVDGRGLELVERATDLAEHDDGNESDARQRDDRVQCTRVLLVDAQMRDACC